MAKPTLIFDARIGKRRVKIRQMELSGVIQYNLAITGGGWSIGGFWGTTKPEKRLEYAIHELAVVHPRTPWNVIIGQSILDNARDINQLFLENVGYNFQGTFPATFAQIAQAFHQRHYIKPARTDLDIRTAFDKLLAQGIYYSSGTQNGTERFSFDFELYRNRQHGKG